MLWVLKDYFKGPLNWLVRDFSLLFFNNVESLFHFCYNYGNNLENTIAC